MRVPLQGGSQWARSGGAGALRTGWLGHKVHAGRAGRWASAPRSTLSKMNVLSKSRGQHDLDHPGHALVGAQTKPMSILPGRHSGTLGSSASAGGEKRAGKER